LIFWHSIAPSEKSSLKKKKIKETQNTCMRF